MINGYIHECNLPVVIGVKGIGKSIFITIENLVSTNDVEGLIDFLKNDNKDLRSSGMFAQYFLKAANLGHAKICNVFLEHEELNLSCLLVGSLSKHGCKIVKNILGFDDEYFNLLLKECYMKKMEERENILNKFKDNFLLNNNITNKESFKVKCNKI